MPEAWRYPYYSASIGELKVGDAKNLEWVLANGIGGYSSSTALGLNTRRCHGVLVASSRNLTRKLVLSGIDEEVHHNGTVSKLWFHAHSNGIDAPGKDCLNQFKFNLDSVVWVFDLDGVRVEKRLEVVPGKNIVLLQYKVENKFDSGVQLKVTPLVNCRNINSLRDGDVGFKSNIFDGHAAGISTEGSYLLLYSEQLSCTQADVKWVHGIKYDYDRDGVEGLHTPVSFTLSVGSKEKAAASLVALSYGSEEEAVKVFKELSESRSHERRQKLLSSSLGDDLIAFSASCDSFIVDYLGKKTVVAGYPCLGFRGRDALIAIPGLALVNRRFDLAEKVFENFLNKMQKGLVPSEFVEGVPQYESLDVTLWLIASLHEYRKCVGDERFSKFMWTYWHDLKNALEHFKKFEKNGLLQDDSKTWMTSLDRRNAVEVQGLWYNALKVMQNFSVLLNDSLNVSYLVKKFEQNFMKNFWNGSYLRDTPMDDSFTPNQLVVLSLDYCPVGFEEAKSVLSLAESELLTSMGLRTLPKNHPKYIGKCSETTNKSHYCGAVWPWLAGPYFRAQMKYNKNGVGRKALEFVKEFLSKNLRQAGIGTVSELFDGDFPHTPRGCISHAMNSGELMRTYSDAIKVL